MASAAAGCVFGIGTATGASEIGTVAVAGATAATTGMSVIGPYPDYVDLARDIGANFFSVPPAEWDAMTDAERWAANQQFLDSAIGRGDVFRLATTIDNIVPGSYTAKEVQYLISQGYQLNNSGNALIPGGR
jgi:hypothetical protein